MLFCEFYTLIQPKPSATENARIARMKIGAIHLIITTYKPWLLNVPSVAFTSSMTVFGFIMNPIKIHVKKATIGINTLLLTKSKNVNKS